jgi:hypothetical protein
MASKAAFTADERIYGGVCSHSGLSKRIVGSAQRDVRQRRRIHGSQEQCDRDLQDGSGGLESD